MSLVLDYVYQGRMYIKACQLQHILGVIEVLSLECGVSVSKKVKEEDEAWVEEAVFQSFTDKGLGEVCKKLKIKEEEAFCTTSEKSNNLRRNSNCWWETAGNRRNNDDPGYEEEEDGEEAIEVVPKVSRSVRNSVANDEDEGIYSSYLSKRFILGKMIFKIGYYIFGIPKVPQKLKIDFC